MSEKVCSIVFMPSLIIGKACMTLVQSLNSPFFPPHKGAEPGQAFRLSPYTQNAKIVACILLFRNSCYRPNLKRVSKYGFFQRFGGKKWRNSEHAHANYPGLSFRPPGFSPYMRREERRLQGLAYF